MRYLALVISGVFLVSLAIPRNTRREREWAPRSSARARVISSAEAKNFTIVGRPNALFSTVVAISPGSTIQNFVDANPAGTTFVLQPGTFRMQEIRAKNGDVFVGRAGVSLNGSALITSFSRQVVNGVTYWVAAGPRLAGKATGICDAAYPFCKLPEELFIDNQPLRRVATLADVIAGTCYFDYAGAKIYFLDDPTGRIVESSVTRVAFEQGPDNLTIQGLTIEKYANPSQMGAVGDQHAGSGWLIQSNEIRWNHGTGIKVGASARIIGNYIHDNGQLGIFGRSGALIENNEIARNNRAGFSVTWEAGGAKFGDAQNLIVRGNNIHDNVGDGLWCDGPCSGGLYEKNVIVNNANNGIAHEIGHSCTIRNNVLIANGFGSSSRAMHGAGIIVNESDNVEVYSNFVANNYKGIILNMSARNDCVANGMPFICDLNNDYVHDNTVVQSRGLAAALYQNVNNDDYYLQKGNRFSNNHYCLGNSMPGQTYWWNNEYRSRAQWVHHGEDVTGKWSCPGVFISSPDEGATVSGRIAVSAFAADKVEVNAFKLYIDNTLATPGTTVTYNYPQSSKQAGVGATYTWDTAQLNDGAHNLLAKASTAHGESSSASSSVTTKSF